MSLSKGVPPSGSGLRPGGLSQSSLSRAEPLVPNAWECFTDVAYYDMWCVRPVGERRFGCGFHLSNGDEANGLTELLTESAVANPWRDAA